MIYLASPYSHKDPYVRELRTMLTEKIMVELLLQGRNVVSSIVLMHDAANRYDMPKDALFWESYNKDLQSACTATYILCPPGWRESKGVKMEIDHAKELGHNRTYITVHDDGRWEIK